MVDRFTMDSGAPAMTPDPAGEWVRWEEHAAALARIKALEAEVAWQAQEAQRVSALFDKAVDRAVALEDRLSRAGYAA